MRYKGYAVTYTGELLKVNRENYFLNGVCKEEPERSDVYDENNDFGRRNLYAVSSGVKCDEDGAELAFLAVDLMKGYFGVDFAKEFRAYFNAANSAINGHILEKSGEHFEVDTSLLYIENDTATVYNIGDMPVFYFEQGKLKRLSGDAPKTVEVEKNIYDKSGGAHTRVLKRSNIPYLGFSDEECEPVPYVSQSIKLKKKAFFVLCSKSVCDVVGEKIIERVLADKEVKSTDKATRIMDIAIEKNPSGNYTVQVVRVDKGIPVTDSDAKSVGLWTAVALLCAALYFTSPYIVTAITDIVDSSKAFIENYVGKEVEPDGDLKWIPRDTEEEEEQQSEEPEDEIIESDVNTETAKPAAPATAAPPANNKPKPQKPAVQQPEEQTPQTPAEPKQEVELPGTTAAPETDNEVELPIDFN